MKLENLQQTITKYGPDHFCPQGKHALLYFKLLVLTQQFDASIGYLSSFGKFFKM
jgi:hypothetical protein